jgi:uncharacterized membrane protein YeaQ/YmgE (transglycosylase-associated protein family)
VFLYVRAYRQCIRSTPIYDKGENMVSDIGGLIGSIIAAPFICIGWIIIGIVAGALARALMGSPNRPFWSDMVLGLIGAFVGGILASLFGLYRPDGGIEAFLVNIVIATVGAAILIALGRAFGGRRRV